VLMFLVGCLLTLAAAIALEVAGDQIAAHLGMSGVIFGATLLAASTSLRKHPRGSRPSACTITSWRSATCL
jgi:hypothetical protein